MATKHPRCYQNPGKREEEGNIRIVYREIVTETSQIGQNTHSLQISETKQTPNITILKNAWQDMT